MRNAFYPSYIQAWAGLYTVIGGLCSKEDLNNLRPELLRLIKDLERTNGFEVAIQSFWAEFKWDLPITELGAREKVLVVSIQQFLLGRLSLETFTKEIRRFA